MNPNKINHYIEFKLQGSDDDRGKVRIYEFKDFLDSVSTILKKIETSVSDSEKPSTYYRIINLKVGSATIGIEAVPYKKEEDYSASILDRFTEGVNIVQEGDVLPEWVDDELLENFKNLIKPLRKHVKSIEIKRNGQKLAVTKQLEVNIEKVLEKHLYINKGTITGYLDTLNVHKTDQFHIYPPIGPTKICCNFNEELLPKIKEGIKKYVNVLGTMHYRENEAFPFKIDAEDIEVYPPENELPTLESIKGMAPEVTGDLDPVDFVKKLREEYDS